MRLFHPHYHRLGKTHDKIISLFMSIIILTGLIFSLIIFNITLFFVKKVIKDTEKTLNANLYWDKIIFTPDLSVKIYNFTIITEDNTEPFYSDYIQIQLSASTMIKVLFNDFDNIPMYKKLDFDNKSLEFILIKSIHAIQVNNPKIDISIQKDTVVLNNVINTMFSKRTYPIQALLNITNPRFLYRFNSGKIDLVSNKIHVLLNEEGGIKIDNYLINARLNFLANQYKTIIRGTSYLYSIQAGLFKHTIQTSNIHLNRSLILMPLHIKINTDTDAIYVNLFQNDKSLFTLQSTIVEKQIKISSFISSLELKDIFQLSSPSQFSTLLKTTLEGYFTSNFDTQTNKLDYVFVVKNEQDKQNKDDFYVDINIEGNEQKIIAKNFLLTYHQQIIDWKGSFDIQNMIPHGTIKSYIDSPFVDIPFQASINFSFLPSLNTTKATIYNFKLHGISQTDFTITFNYTDTILQIYEEGKTYPVIKSKVNIPSTQPVISNNISSFIDEKNTYSLEINTLNLKIIDGLLFNNDNIDIFSNININGIIDIIIVQNKIQKIDYDVDIKNVEESNLAFKSKGSYVLNKGLQAKGKLELGAFLNIKFETTHTEKRKIVDDKFYVLIQTQYSIPTFNEKTKYSENKNTNEINQSSASNNISDFTTFEDNFLLHGSITKKSISLFLDNIFQATIFFDKTDINTIDINFNKFSVSGLQNILDGNINIVFNQGDVSSIDTQLKLSNDNFIVFQTDMSYNNNIGTIQNFILASEEDIFRGEGSFIYTTYNKELQFEIIENMYNLSVIVSRKIQGSFNPINNNLSIDVHNINPSFFNKEITGKINATLNIKLDLSYVLLNVKNTDITIISSNDRYIINGNANINKNSFQLKNIKIQRNDSLYQVSNAVFSEKKAKINGIVSFQELPDIPPLYIDIELLADNSILDLQYLLQKDAPLPVAKGYIEIISLSNKDRNISNNFHHNIKFNSNKNIFTITEQQNKLYLTRDAKGIIRGRIGNYSLAWNILISGSLFEDDVKIQFDIVDIDIARFIIEASLQKSLPITLSQGNIKGTAFMRGTIEEPKFYASIRSSFIEFQHPQLSQNIYFNALQISVNDNRISIPNSFITIANTSILMNGTGYINNYSLGTINLDFISLENYFKISKLNISNVILTGLIKGSISLLMEPQLMSIKGDIYLKNTTFYISDENDTENTKANNTTLNVDINIHSEKNVIYYWPNPTFPLLKSNLKKAQKLKISYDSSIDLADIYGNIELQSGLIYYFNKGFNIINGSVLFDKEIHPVPIIENFEAILKTRLNKQNYLIRLQTLRSFFDNIDFNISSEPPLSNFDLNIVLGTSNFEDNNNVQQSFNDPFDNINKTLASFGDQLSNIGIISQFERTLAQALDIDYISFRTKIFKNLVSYAITGDAQNNTTSSFFTNTTLNSLIDGSYIEIGKYIDLAYFSFILEVREQQFFSSVINPLYGSFVFSPQLNVEIPTPIINIGWSFNFSSLINNNTINTVPLNTVTLSWQKRY